MTTAAPHNTQHRKIWDSPWGETIQNNKVLSCITAAGTAVAIEGASAQSAVFSKISEKAIVPAAGATIARLGAAAMEDAMVNDWQENKTRASGKLTAGALATLSGTEAVGRAYDIPIANKALSGTLEKVIDNGESLLGAGLVTGGVKAGQYALNAANAATQDAENRLTHTAKAIGAGAGGTVATLAGVQMIGEQHNIPLAKKALTGTLEMIADSKTAIGASGAALAGGALISADQAVKNIKKGGNEFASAALASGSLAGGLGGAELMGRAANISQAENLFIDNADWLQGLSASSMGLAWASNAKNRIQNDALTGSRGLEVAAGAATTFAGLAHATEHLSDALSTPFGKAAELGASGGLALAAVGFSKQAADALENHKPEAGLFNGALAAFSAAGSLFALGQVLESPLIDKLGETIQSHTLEPLAKHLITPAIDYLYNNPIAGGMLLIGGAGAMIHHRGRYNEESLFDD